MQLRLLGLLLTGLLFDAACFSPENNGGETDETTDGSSATTAEATDSATTTGPNTSPSTTETGTSTAPTTGPDATTTNATTGDTSTTSVDSSSGEPDVCPATHRCVSEAPEGWIGPVAFDNQPFADPATVCQDSYPNEALVANGDIVDTPAECTCSCGTATGESCSGGLLRLYAGSSNCPGIPSVNIFVPTACLDVAGSSGSFRAQAGVPLGGSCAPSLNTVLPTPEWGTRGTACTGALFLGGCAAEEVCAPNPPSGFPAPLCVYADGTNDCPAAAGYTERTIYFEGALDDQRSCADTCSCSEPEGALCEGQIVVFTDNICLSSSVGVPADDTTCVNGTATGQSLRYIPDLTAGSCEPSDVEPAGEILGTSPVTVCCTP